MWKGSIAVENVHCSYVTKLNLAYVFLSSR